MSSPHHALSRRAFMGSAAAVVAATTGSGRALASPSPALASPAARTPANVQVSPGAAATHIEPSLAVNRHDPRNLLAASRSFQAGRQEDLTAYASFDSGRTWHASDLPGGSAANPAAAFDAHGNGFIGAYVQQSSVLIWRTSDGGRSFQPPVTAATGSLDHPGLAIDQWARTSPGTVYLTGAMFGATQNGLAFYRSADGGRSFGQPRFIDPVTGSGGRVPVIAAGPGGLVCIAYYVYLADGSGPILTAITSADHGATFAAPVQLAAVTDGLSLGGITVKSGPAVAVAPRTGHIHAVAADNDQAGTRSEIVLFSSRDQGRTWTSTSLAVSSAVSYLQPQVAAGDNGQVAVSAYALAPPRADVLLFTSRPPQPPAAPPLRVTTRSFDPALAVNAGGGPWLGNYQAITSTSNAYHPIWTDTRTGSAQIFTATVSAP